MSDEKQKAYVRKLIWNELEKSFSLSFRSNKNEIPFWLILLDLLRIYNSDYHGKIELSFKGNFVARPKRLCETPNIQEKYHEILINFENLIS